MITATVPGGQNSDVPDCDGKGVWLVQDRWRSKTRPVVEKVTNQAQMDTGQAMR